MTTFNNRYYAIVEATHGDLIVDIYDKTAEDDEPAGYAFSYLPDLEGFITELHHAGVDIYGYVVV